MSSALGVLVTSSAAARAPSTSTAARAPVRTVREFMVSDLQREERKGDVIPELQDTSRFQARSGVPCPCLFPLGERGGTRQGGNRVAGGPFDALLPGRGGGAAGEEDRPRAVDEGPQAGGAKAGHQILPLATPSAEAGVEEQQLRHFAPLQAQL